MFERWEASEQVIAFVEARFGIDPEPLRSCAWWIRGEQAIWISSGEVQLDGLSAVEAVGMLVMRRPPPRGQLGSPFLRRFGQAARRNVITLDDAAARRFISGEDLVLESTPGVGFSEGCSEGMMIVRGRLGVIGRGRWSDGTLRCELPKESRIVLL